MTFYKPYFERVRVLQQKERRRPTLQKEIEEIWPPLENQVDPNHLYTLDLGSAEPYLNKLNIADWENPTRVGCTFPVDQNAEYHSLFGDLESLYVGTYPSPLPEVRIYLKGRWTVTNDVDQDIYIWNGVEWAYAGRIKFASLSYVTKYKKISNILNTKEKINNARLSIVNRYITYDTPTRITYAYLWVKNSNGETETLPVDGWVPEIDQWGKVGTEPWLNTDDGDTSYITAVADGITDQYYTFQNLTIDWPSKGRIWKVNKEKFTIDTYKILPEPGFMPSVVCWWRDYLIIGLEDYGAIQKVTRDPLGESVETLHLSGTPPYIGDMKIDKVNTDILWLGSSATRPDGLSGTRIYKIDLKEWKVLGRNTLTGTKGSLFAIGQDKDYIYGFAMYGRLFKIKKEDLSEINYADAIEYPRRYVHVYGGKIYVSAENGIARYDTETLARDYIYIHAVYWGQNLMSFEKDNILWRAYQEGALEKIKHDGSFTSEGDWQYDPNYYFVVACFCDKEWPGLT